MWIDTFVLAGALVLLCAVILPGRLPDPRGSSSVAVAGAVVGVLVLSLIGAWAMNVLSSQAQPG
ncbi:hypothetical protein GIS00_23155 [Nakamurella sp. YIM 132087]|uniref:Uncharacterized protein n=1 Tax=Nakamurella alba TaxID=2665158 RepID=A0A7K1FRR7_9ACTN|nr:hypothetical protein [Nakamurella alba]MTD16836.1 hypothetical protein [Nakamurella alba]